MNRNSKAFQQALGQTLAELASRGVTVGPNSIADAIEHNITTVSKQLRIQEQAAWRHFDAARLADTIVEQMNSLEPDLAGGQAPFPPIDNPELAMILAGVPDALAESGGDLYAVILNVAVNAWMAGHLHGEDGCTGCSYRGETGHDWQARMDAITTAQPDIIKWFDRDTWTEALDNVGYTVERR
ncbi:hypothetical protein [Kitasatospora sp. NPDC001132]